MPISFLKNGNKNNISMVNRPNIITTMGQGTFRMFVCISFQKKIGITFKKTKASKSWVSDLSVGVSFVSELATVLSEYWKDLEEMFLWNNIVM